MNEYLCKTCTTKDECPTYSTNVISCNGYKKNHFVKSEDIVTDGLKHDGGKLRLDLVPAELIEAVGAVLTHGAEKYGENSWQKVEPKRYRAALMRHLCKWLKNPFGKDEDSGLPHLWHIACNVAFLIVLDKEKTK
jgi:hypothetical protein